MAMPEALGLKLDRERHGHWKGDGEAAERGGNCWSRSCAGACLAAAVAGSCDMEVLAMHRMSADKAKQLKAPAPAAGSEKGEIQELRGGVWMWNILN